jgi:putative hydrolase
MAEDRTSDPADQPEDDKTPPGDNPPEPYRLGGSGRSGKGPESSSGKGGGEPSNPFEAFLSSFAGGDMNALAAQLQSAFAMLGGAGSASGGGTTEPGSGVNWEVTKDTARKTVASLGPDPTPDAGQQRAVTEAVELAEVWPYQATAFPRVSTTVAAWSRAEWIEQTMPVWRRSGASGVPHCRRMEGALNFGGTEEAAGPPGMAGMEQMLRPMLRTSGASMFGLQLGQGLGQLATEVVGATDIGLPLSEPGHVALLPTNIKAFGDGLEQSSSDVTLYLALRECARQRLFASAGWLRAQMLTLVEQYASGITIDTSALEQAVGQLDPSNLEELSSCWKEAIRATKDARAIGYVRPVGDDAGPC